MSMNRELLVQLHWLVIHQCKSDITNLIFMHNLTSVARQGQIHTGQIQEAFKFSVQKMFKDLLQNGKHIDLKQEQEAVIRV